MSGYIIGCTYVNEAGDEVPMRDVATLENGEVVYDEEARMAFAIDGPDDPDDAESILRWARQRRAARAWAALAFPLFLPGR